MLHEKNIILSVETTHTPRAEPNKRVRIEPVGATFQRVILRFGYMETPNIPRALGAARKLGLQFDIMSTSFFLSRRALRPAPRSGMPRWQDRLFITLARSANDATDYFQIPTNRVVEAAVQCRHPGQGCRQRAHRRSEYPFAAVLRAAVRPGETQTAKMDCCCPTRGACSTGPLKQSAIVVGRDLNLVAEFEAARLDTNDGLFWRHPQMRRWPSRLS